MCNPEYYQNAKQGMTPSNPTAGTPYTGGANAFLQSRQSNDSIDNEIDQQEQDKMDSPSTPFKAAQNAPAAPGTPPVVLPQANKQVASVPYTPPPTPNILPSTSTPAFGTTTSGPSQVASSPLNIDLSPGGIVPPSPMVASDSGNAGILPPANGPAPQSILQQRLASKGAQMVADNSYNPLFPSSLVAMATGAKPPVQATPSPATQQAPGMPAYTDLFGNPASQPGMLYSASGGNQVPVSAEISKPQAPSTPGGFGSVTTTTGLGPVYAQSQQPASNTFGSTTTQTPLANQPQAAPQTMVAQTPQAPATQGKPGDKVNNFITQMRPAAVQVAKKLNVDPNVILAHWAYESAWGKSKLSTQANNFGGIKAFNGEPSVSMATREHDGSEKTNANFKSYPSPEAYANDYAAFLKKPRYKQALNTDNATQFATALGNAGYHQDNVQGYAQNIQRLKDMIDQRQQTL